MNPLLTWVLWSQFLGLAFFTAVTFISSKGEPWSITYFAMAIVYLVFGFYFIVSLDLVVDFETVKVTGSVAPANGLDNVKRQVELWKLIFPVISIGIGCSMVNSFLSSPKPRM